jgi:hypothetical protein
MAPKLATDRQNKKAKIGYSDLRMQTKFEIDGTYW